MSKQSRIRLKDLKRTPSWTFWRYIHEDYAEAGWIEAFAMPTNTGWVVVGEIYASVSGGQPLKIPDSGLRVGDRRLCELNDCTIPTSKDAKRILLDWANETLPALRGATAQYVAELKAEDDAYWAAEDAKARAPALVSIESP